MFSRWCLSIPSVCVWLSAAIVSVEETGCTCKVASTLVLTMFLYGQAFFYVLTHSSGSMTMFPTTAVWGSVPGGTLEVSVCHPMWQWEMVNHIQPTNSGPPCNCYRALSISCNFLCLSSFGCILKTVRLPCFCKDLTIPASQCGLNWTSCCLNGAVCPSPRH